MKVWRRMGGAGLYIFLQWVWGQLFYGLNFLFFFRIIIHVNVGFAKMKWSFLVLILIGVFNPSAFVCWQREAFPH